MKALDIRRKSGAYSWITMCAEEDYSFIGNVLSIFPRLWEPIEISLGIDAYYQYTRSVSNTN